MKRKICRELRSHYGLESYNPCDVGLVEFMGEMRNAYGMDGGDANYEDDVELRHGATISPNRPINTVLALDLCPSVIL